MLDLLSATPPLLLAVSLIAGLVRGFSGFGAGMIFVPVAAALVGPAQAVALLWLADGLSQLFLLKGAASRANYRDLAPLFAGYVIGLPVGIWLLLIADPIQLRWVIGAMILSGLAAMLAGVRASRETGVPGSLALGATSGITGGATGLSGLPIILFWLAGRASGADIRAGLTMFFFATSIVTGIGFVYAGIVTQAALMTAMLVVPLYGFGIALGSIIFKLAPERAFRPVALTIVAIAAITTLPAFDAWFRS
jgi:uncharacterized membrane protein YfcA